MERKVDQKGFTVGGGKDSWFNVEDNSDLDTSNESYMSSSSEEEDQSSDLRGTFSATPQGVPSSSAKELKQLREFTREEKALVSRRFDPYFDSKRLNSDDFWRQSSKRRYDVKDWIKLTFDSQVKRCNTVPV